MHDPHHRKSRETVLSLALVLMLAGLIWFFLFLLTSVVGVMAFIPLVVVAVALLAYFHYLLWGHSFSQETAGEREEEELRQRLEARERQPPHDLY